MTAEAQPDTSHELGDAILATRDQEAARVRAGDEYIVGLIESREPELRALLAVGHSEGEIPGLLFKEVATTLGHLDHHYVRPFGVVLTSMVPGNLPEHAPLSVKLGWANYFPMYGQEDKPQDEARTYVYDLTEAGRAAVNGLRQARGEISIEEERRRSRVRWDLAIEAADAADGSET
jgi:hypothetical protein